MTRDAHTSTDAAGRPKRDAPWIFRTYAGHTNVRGLERALPRQPVARADRPLDRLRSADPVRLRLRPPAGRPGDRQGRRADQQLDDFHVLFDGIPIEEINTSMTINATAMWLLSLYVALAERARRRSQAAPGHDPERHHQGVPGARDLHLPAAGHRCGSSPTCTSTACTTSRAGTRRTSARTTCRRRARRRRRSWPSRWPTAMGVLDAIKARGTFSDDEFERCVGRVSFFVQRRHPVRRGDVQDARVRRAVGRDHARPLRRAEPEVPALPLRRAGELARPHRGAAREQRLAHPDRGARRHAEPQRPLPRAPAPDLERGALPAAAVGPAVVAAPAADPRVRDRPARVPRPLRRARRSSRPRWRRSKAAAWAEIEQDRRAWAAPSRRSSRAT